MTWFCAVTIGALLMACDGNGETTPTNNDAHDGDHGEAPAVGDDANAGGDEAQAGGDAHGGAHGGAHGHGEAAADVSADMVAVPEGARSFFVSPADKAEVTSPLTVEMGVEGMQVQPAGEVKAGTGHHHIIIDGQSIGAGTPVPADDRHIHYGQGQTSTTLELAPGEHTLTLQFANGVHLSYGPQMSSTITVTVK
jgi:hypothetical protein